MTDHRNQLSPDEDRFVHALRSSYKPEDRDPARRVHLNERLSAALSRRSTPSWRPLAAAAVAAAGCFALLLATSLQTTRTEHVPAQGVAIASIDEDELLLALAFGTDGVDEEDWLPADYVLLDAALDM